MIFGMAITPAQLAVLYRVALVESTGTGFTDAEMGVFMLATDLMKMGLVRLPDKVMPGSGEGIGLTDTGRATLAMCRLQFDELRRLDGRLHYPEKVISTKRIDEMAKFVTGHRSRIGKLTSPATADRELSEALSIIGQLIDAYLAVR